MGLCPLAIIAPSWEPAQAASCAVRASHPPKVAGHWRGPGPLALLSGRLLYLRTTCNQGAQPSIIDV
jgi:hypothetical protein